MPFLLAREGKLIAQNSRLAGNGCTDCCGTGPQARYVLVRDCCFPTEQFWIDVGQRGRNGEALYIEGQPVTFDAGTGCSVTDPEDVRTLPEILAEFPDPTIIAFTGGSEPLVRTNCDDPLCPPCPQCCVAREIPADQCGGPLCCEHGGDFNLELSVSHSYLEKSRVYGSFGFDIECQDCLFMSGEGTTATGSALFQLVLNFQCQQDGTYLARCVDALRFRNLTRWNIDGIQNAPCQDVPDGFAPVLTEADNLDFSDGCAEIFPTGIIQPGEWFAMTRAEVRALLPFLGGLGGTFGAPTADFARVCNGTANEFEVIDRTFTEDPCEARLSQFGDTIYTNRSWSGTTDCEGGSFTFTGEYGAGYSTRFHPGPGVWVPFVSSARYNLAAEWRISRGGSPTCNPPQCGGGPTPLSVLERRSGLPARARVGCSKCGGDGGL